MLTAKAELQVSLQDDDNDENLPAYPSAPSLGQVHQMTPSDTTAFRMYSESLAKNGHNLDPSLIVNAICNHGGSIIFKGSSDWIIDPTLDRHLWGSIGFVEQSGGVVVNGARSANSHYGSVGSIGGGMMGGGGGIGIGGGPPTIVQLLQVPDTMRQTDAPPSDRERVETEIIKSPPPWRRTPPRRRRPPTTRTPPSSPPPPSGWL